MTRAERAEIAFRIAGLALAARGVCRAVETLRFLWGEVPVYWLVSYSLMAAAGGLVFCFPRRLSRLLVRPATSAHDKAAQHALQLGIVLIALAWLLISLAVALACTVTPQSASAFGIRSICIVHGVLALAVCLSVMRGQRGVARFLGRRIGPEARMPTGAVLVAGAGFALLALRATAQAGVSIVANALIWWPYVGAGASRMAGIPAAQIALGVALLAFLLPLARWAAGGTGQDAGELPGGLNRRTFLEIAILICAACLLSVSIPWILDWSFGLWRGFGVWKSALTGGPLVAACVVGALAAAVGAAVLITLGTILARWASKEVYRSDDVQRGTDAARIVLETALGVVALWGAISLLAERSLSLEETCLSAGFALLVFVFRADIAWLLSGRPEPPETVTRAQRAAALCPWLALLGMMYVLSGLPGFAYETAQRIGGHLSVTMTNSRMAVPGVLLVVGGRWLAKIVSHGPLLCRLRKRQHPVQGS